MLALVRDINFDLIPSRLNYSINFDRFYSENTLRNNDPDNLIPIPTTYNKTFNITTSLWYRLESDQIINPGYRCHQPGHC